MTLQDQVFITKKLCFSVLKNKNLLSKLPPKNMGFGLCPAGTEFYNFTKASIELQMVCTFKKYGSQCLARLLRLFLTLTTVFSLNEKSGGKGTSN